MKQRCRDEEPLEMVSMQRDLDLVRLVFRCGCRFLLHSPASRFISIVFPCPAIHYSHAAILS